MTAPWIVTVSVLWAYSIGLGVLVLGLLRRIGAVLDSAEQRLSEPLHVRPPGLEPGVHIPAFEGTDQARARFDHTRLYGRRSLLVFLAPDCQPCRALAPELSRVQLDGADIFAVLPDSEEGRDFAQTLSVPVVYQAGREISVAFGTSVTPHVFAIDERGVVVGTGTANDARGVIDVGTPLLKGGELANRRHNGGERTARTSAHH